MEGRKWECYIESKGVSNTLVIKSEKLGKKLIEFGKNKTLRKGICVIALLVAVIVIGRQNFWITEEEFNKVEENDVSYMELSNDTTYHLTYLCMLKKLEYISYEIKNEGHSSGKLIVSVTDSAGSYIAPEYEFDLSKLNSETSVLPTYMVEPTKIGHLYTFNFYVSGTDENSPIKIKCADTKNTVTIMKQENRRISKKVSLFYSGKGFFRIQNVFKIMILFIIVIFLLWMKHKIVVKNCFFKELIIILYAGLGFVISEIATGQLLNIMWTKWLVNSFIVYIILKAISFFMKKFSPAATITMIFCFSVGTAEHFVMQFRGMPFVPWDLKVLNTAATVVGSYEFSLSLGLVLAFELLVIAILLAGKIQFERKEQEHPHLIKIVEFSWVYLCVIVLITSIVPTLDASVWGVDGVYQSQGFLASFIAYTRYMHYDEPDGYSEDKCEEILANQKAVKSDTTIKAKNIIIVMNESFSDLRVINEKMIGDNYMPFFDSCTENTIKGNLCVPVYGAGTSNSEFEVLTGISTRHTPSTPYVTSINFDINSLCRTLDDDGFSSFAFHPYLIENWNRNNAYPHLGFEKLYDIEDLDEPDYVRWCVSDHSNYEKVIQLYEENADEPFFMFNVTMQNHGGYEEEYDNFSITTDLSRYGDFPQAETYFSLVKDSDAALEELINYFKNVDEPTLICFFGDHQPSIENEFYEKLYGKSLSELSPEENMKRFETPFLIWTNYDIESATIDKISANYLEDLILLTAGRDLEGYEAFTYNLYLEYPVISMNGIYDSDGNYYYKEDEIEDELLGQYQQLEYYRMNTRVKEIAK